MMSIKDRIFLSIALISIHFGQYICLTNELTPKGVYSLLTLAHISLIAWTLKYIYEETAVISLIHLVIMGCLLYYRCFVS